MTMGLLCRLRDAAAGMAYLEERSIVHRDLALRNLLVAPGSDGQSKYIVKVSDFGLSRPMEKGYYRTADQHIPVRWCAPEVFQQGIFTSKVMKCCCLPSSLLINVSNRTSSF